MKRYIISSNTTPDKKIRITDGEYLDDAKLANELAHKVYEQNIVDQADLVIEEAAKYYTSDSVEYHEYHEYDAIVQRAKEILHDLVEYDEDLRRKHENDPTYQVYGFKDRYRNGKHSNMEDEIHAEDPKDAIASWFKLAQKYGRNTSIIAKDKQSAMHLLSFANNNRDLLLELSSEYGCPYNINRFMNEIQSAASGKMYGFATKYSSDQVYPFSNR